MSKKSKKSSKSKFSLPVWHKHPFVLPVTTFMVLFFVACAGLIFTNGQTLGPSDSKRVKLSVDGKTQVIPTRAEDVNDLLKRLNITLNDKDVVEPAGDTPIYGDSFSVNIYRSRPVTIVDDQGQTIVTRAADRQPIAIAKKAGLTVYPEDVVKLTAPDKAVEDGIVGDQVYIDRAIPIKLSLYGATYDVRTQADTVADLAKERKFSYDQSSVLPKPQTKLKAGDVVFVTEPGKQIATSEELIVQPVEYVDSTEVPTGSTKTREEGRPGKKVIIYDVAQDGKKRVLQEIIVSQPTRKLIARGAAKPKDVNATFDGDFQAALARLRSCEGSYTSATGNGYYGAYQFDVRTWNGFGGYQNAAQAPPIVQDQKAWETYQRRGWQPWPSCKIKMGLQDVYR